MEPLAAVATPAEVALVSGGEVLVASVVPLPPLASVVDCTVGELLGGRPEAGGEFVGVEDTDS